MTPEQISSPIRRACSPQAQRESYFEKGYVLVENVVPDEWIERLRDITNEFVERSREVSESDAVWDLEPDHTPEQPRLRPPHEPRSSSTPPIGSSRRTPSWPTWRPTSWGQTVKILTTPS